MIATVLELANIAAPFVSPIVALYAAAKDANLTLSFDRFSDTEIIYATLHGFPVSWNGEKWETGWI